MDYFVPNLLRNPGRCFLVGGEEAGTMKGKDCKCGYHEITHGAGQERCLACGVPYDRKKAKLFKYMDSRRKKK